MKYSKGLLDLINAEESLVRLKQYDDAKNVRRMIDRILPGEEVRCWTKACARACAGSELDVTPCL